ncbi:cytochrome P450 [Streptomyces finlayi]|uniref:cytochrome P450 n=1 Tax=Streptomyces finlayi TaxID=67296 RepID=UPI00167BBC0E|nr:cytochrome P450 [Streptomyces finlayi]
MYPDPERFDPDRWATVQGRLRPPHGALIPFGSGARKCIGDTFAVVETTLALATLAAHWSLEISPGTQPRPTLGLVLYPRALHMIPRSRPGAS